MNMRLSTVVMDRSVGHSQASMASRGLNLAMLFTTIYFQFLRGGFLSFFEDLVMKHCIPSVMMTPCLPV